MNIRLQNQYEKSRKEMNLAKTNTKPSKKKFYEDKFQTPPWHKILLNPRAPRFVVWGNFENLDNSVSALRLPVLVITCSHPWANKIRQKLSIKSQNYLRMSPIKTIYESTCVSPSIKGILHRCSLIWTFLGKSATYFLQKFSISDNDQGM